MAFKLGWAGRLMHGIIYPHAHFDDLDLATRSQWLGRGEGVGSSAVELSRLKQAIKVKACSVKFCFTFPWLWKHFALMIMTFGVDWALKNNYLPIFENISLAWPACLRYIWSVQAIKIWSTQANNKQQRTHYIIFSFITLISNTESPLSWVTLQ